AHKLVDDAFAIIEGNASRFSAGEDFPPELLVLFSEANAPFAASDLGGHELQVQRALELHDRLGSEDDQFRARALLVRCLFEARLGTATHRLKGFHLLQQLQYALRFLVQALGIATEAGWAQNDTRYGFLVYNASLVFWNVARPMCRLGWQRHIVNETAQVLDALRKVRDASAGGAAGKGGKDASGGVAIPTQVDLPWLIELTLNLAFGLEDAGRDADAQKKADEAGPLLDECAKEQQAAAAGKGEDEEMAVAARIAKLRSLVLNARAYFARKAPGKTKEEIDKASGSTMTGTVYFATNGGIAPENCGEELIKAWQIIDKDFDLRAAVAAFDPQDPKGNQAAGGGRANLKPQRLIDLACAVRAACFAKLWPLAVTMLSRLETWLQ
ncbi:unnamed protein product, partial [Polarella glacialis]